MWWKEKIGRSCNTLDSFSIPFILQNTGCEGENILGAGAVWDVCLQCWSPGAVLGVSFVPQGQSQEELVLCECGACPDDLGKLLV